MIKSIKKEKHYEQVDIQNKCKWLKTLLERLQNSNDEQETTSIADSIDRSLAQIFGRESLEYSHFNSISITDKAKLEKTLSNIITQLKAIGLPQNNSQNMSQQELNINTNVNQNQNIQIELVQRVLQEEMPPRVLKEIQGILNSKSAEENKFKKVVDGIKEAGIDVTSSTLAKIITSLIKGH